MADVDLEDGEEEDINISTTYTKQSNYHLKWITYWMFLIMSLPLIILTPQYSYQFSTDVIGSWMDEFYSIFASNLHYFTATGSITNEQFEFYSQSYLLIVLYTIATPLWLFFGFIQFNPYIRHNHNLIHKISTYGYLISLFMSLFVSGALSISMVTKAQHTDEFPFVWTKNGAYHTFIIFLDIAGIITGKFACIISKQFQIISTTSAHS